MTRGIEIVLTEASRKCLDSWTCQWPPDPWGTAANFSPPQLGFSLPPFFSRVTSHDATQTKRFCISNKYDSLCPKRNWDAKKSTKKFVGKPPDLSNQNDEVTFVWKKPFENFRISLSRNMQKMDPWIPLMASDFWWIFRCDHLAHPQKRRRKVVQRNPKKRSKRRTCVP